MGRRGAVGLSLVLSMLCIELAQTVENPSVSAVGGAPNGAMTVLSGELPSGKLQNVGGTEMAGAVPSQFRSSTRVAARATAASLRALLPSSSGDEVSVDSGQFDVSLEMAQGATVAIDDGVSMIVAPVDDSSPTQGAPGNPGQAETLPDVSPDAVQVSVLSTDQAESLGLVGFAFQVEADAINTAVEVSIDYSALADDFGADYAGRMRLVRYPECVLETPEVLECSTADVVETASNDALNETMKAAVPVDFSADVTIEAVDGAAGVEGVDGEPSNDDTATKVSTGGFGQHRVRASGAGGSVYGLSSGLSSNYGSFAATPLAASASWSVGLQMGSFDWSYPVPVPPTGFGSAPGVSLSYSSSAVDGVVSDENTQGGFLGQGWSLNAGGFIERSYKTCTADGGAINDFCWFSDNATIVLNGHASEMYFTGVGSLATWSEWRLKDDPGWKVVRARGQASGTWDNLGEVWYVYSPDGTEYKFGQRFINGTGEGTQSVWYVPVYGNNAGEPCFGTVCNQAWRWNLDRIRDRFGNVTLFKYSAETNLYGAGGNPSAPKVYVRGGWLAEIRYGIREGSEGTYRDRVVFNTKARCFSSGAGDCMWNSPSLTTPWYPDSPTDLRCVAAPCRKTAPGFWTERALVSIETSTLVSDQAGAAPWQVADRVAPTLEWVDVDGLGGQPPQLWLRTISRTGKPNSASPITVPDIRFESNAWLKNRADAIPMNLFRITEVNDEMGGRTTIAYGQKTPCTAQPPAAGWPTNTQDCYPRWTVYNTSVGWGTFNRHLVSSVTRTDLVTGATPVVTTYSYEGTPAYKRDDSPFTANKTWSEPRGYAEVWERTGPSANGAMSVVRHLFFRGINGDSNGLGGTKASSVTYPDGTVQADENWLSGREYLTEGRSGTAVVERDQRFFAAVVTAGSGTTASRRIDQVRSRHSSLESNGAYLESEVRTAYDAYGQPIEVFDAGDVTSAADDRCTSIQYARNAAAVNVWLVGLVSRTYTAKGGPSYPGGWGGNCDETATAELGLVDNYYDGQVLFAALPTGFTTQQWTRASGSSAWLVTGFTGDAAGHLTAVDGPLAGTADTSWTFYNDEGLPYGSRDATGHTHTKQLDPARGLPLYDSDWNDGSRLVPATDGPDKTTYFTYDALGRLTSVKLPGDPDPTLRFEYSVTKTAPSWVKTRTQQTDGSWRESWAYFDGLARQRETQVPAPNGGRLISATEFDARGLAVKQYAGRYDAGPAGSGIRTSGAINSAVVPMETRTTYDNLGRAISTAQYSYGAPVTVGGVAMQTSVVYEGHWVTTYPAGLSPTITHTNVLGLTDVSGIYNTTWTGPKTTTYAYDSNRNMVRSTDPRGNVTTYQYNNLGQVVQQTDPDRGTTATTYNADGSVASVQDVSLGTTLSYTNDVLGRPLEVRSGGVLLEKYAYDAAGEAGLLDYASSFSGTAEFRIDTVGYDSRNRPSGYRYVVPSIAGVTDTNGLAGSYVFDGFVYRRDDQVASVRYPAMGALPAETVTTGFSGLGAPVSLSASAGALVSSTSFTNEGRVGSRVFGDVTAPYRITRSYGWDSATGRLMSMSASQNGVMLQNEVLGYDVAGNLVSNWHDRVPASEDHAECYRYDGRGRLAAAFTAVGADCGAAGVVGPGGGYSSVFAVDEIGNLTAGSAGSYSYPVSGAGVVRPHAPTQVGGVVLGWNADGTLASKSQAGVVSSFGWDVFDRLRSVSRAGVAVSSMWYWPGGQRALLVESGSVSLSFGGWAERVASSAGVVERRWLSLGGTVAGVQQRSPVGVVEWLTVLGDVRGSVAVTVPRGSSVVTSSWWGPYGARRGSRVDTVGTRGYLGQAEDVGSGLTYLNNRYYDPSIGEFISVDPLVSKTGDPYLYATGNPTTLTDPNGLDPCPKSGCPANGEHYNYCNHYYSMGVECRWGLGVGENNDGWRYEQAQLKARDDMYAARGWPSYYTSPWPILAKGLVFIGGSFAQVGCLAADGVLVGAACHAGVAGLTSWGMHAVEGEYDPTLGDAVAAGTAGLVSAASSLLSSRAASLATEAAGLADDGAGLAFRSDTTHIFRDAGGHLAEVTAANRALIQSAIDPANLRATITLPDGATLARYFRTLPDGTQVWAQVRNGIEITNGGLNASPR